MNLMTCVQKCPSAEWMLNIDTPHHIILHLLTPNTDTFTLLNKEQKCSLGISGISDTLSGCAYDYQSVLNKIQSSSVF